MPWCAAVAVRPPHRAWGGTRSGCGNGCRTPRAALSRAGVSPPAVRRWRSATPVAGCWRRRCSTRRRANQASVVCNSDDFSHRKSKLSSSGHRRAYKTAGNGNAANNVYKSPKGCACEKSSRLHFALLHALKTGRRCRAREATGSLLISRGDVWRDQIGRATASRGKSRGPGGELRGFPARMKSCIKTKREGILAS